MAVFGRKDYQQWRVIQRMCRDLDFAVEVVGMPICREQDGLAMSSRNARLTPEARGRAPAIYRALQWAQAAVAEGSEKRPAHLREHVVRSIEEAGGKVDYVEVRALPLFHALDSSLLACLDSSHALTFRPQEPFLSLHFVPPRSLPMPPTSAR